jgi:hypothetical protein
LMFTNLDLRNFTLKREPALWGALVVAVANVIAQGISGGLAWGQAFESIMALSVGFAVRGRVSPA